jgi:hypothetical protein
MVLLFGIMESKNEETMQYIKKVELLPLENYLAEIEGAIDSKQYRHLYALVNGIRQDIVEEGLASCAYFVSAILSNPNAKLLSSRHAGVAGLVRSLEKPENGWTKIDTPTKQGEVIIWEEMKQADGDTHLHSGFYMGGTKAISHIDSTRTPQEHHYTFGEKDGVPVRKIIAVYTHPFLSQ